ncbi:MAG: hypothetical protein K2X82_21830 [Gemmataceae bacterium]|nr:hypothetical protein [Gemmataceae bacterium]
MLGWLFPRCPVGTVDKAWVERRMRWLAGRFGADRLRRAVVVRPTPEFFPDPYDAEGWTRRPSGWRWPTTTGCPGPSACTSSGPGR